MKNDKCPILVILAAGLGSRYGGFKQLDEIGAGNETIMDLSINDAIQAGFQKVVLVINREISAQVNQTVIKKYRQEVDMECAFQEVDLVPSGFDYSHKRTKPWGTAHAILSAREFANEPFAVINADDFYGNSAYQQMKNELITLSPGTTDYCMLGYKLSNTLSTHGGVSRGMCAVSGNHLSSLKEYTNIRKTENTITGNFNGETLNLSSDSIVSMNFWGFTPQIFELLEERFKVFLHNNRESSTAEFFIPDVLDYAINKGLGRVKVLNTTERWFGVTFREDRDEVRKGIQEYLQIKRKRT